MSEIDELRSSMRLQPLREVNDAEEMQGVGVKPGYRKNGCYSTSNAKLLFKQISELSQFLLLEMTFSLELLPPQHTHTHTPLEKTNHSRTVESASNIALLNSGTR